MTTSLRHDDIIDFQDPVICKERYGSDIKTPRPVSVIMPVYNAAPYLSEAVESILNQTFRDFEFIINDGSTDASLDILEHYSHIDRRITVHHQENKGLIHALNRASRLAQGPLLARMDADDISLPTRLERQVAFLENHPEVGVLGSWHESFIQDKEESTLVPLPTQPLSTAWRLLFGTPVPHPTVILRKELLEKSGYYRETAPFIEDRDLWLRVSKIMVSLNLSSTGTGEGLMVPCPSASSVRARYSSEQCTLNNCATRSTSLVK